MLPYSHSNIIGLNLIKRGKVRQADNNNIFDVILYIYINVIFI